MTKKEKKLIAVIGLVVILLTACASKAANATEKIELGQKYLTEANYTEAIAAFTEVIKIDPSNIEAYMGRAEPYKGLKQYDDAKADYTEVIGKTDEMPYTQAQAYMGRAEAYVGLKQYDDAKTDYTTAIEKAVEQPYTRAEAYVGRAEVNEVTNANEAALSDYESAQNILDSIDWSKFKEITDQMLKALQEKIEKACEDLRALLGLNENDEPLDTTAIFQNAIDGVAVDAEYAENERYVIVNDYDGDGKQEAFGFLGIRNDEYQTWESVKLYYLKSDGSVEEIALNGDVTGGPAKVSEAEQMDFSESFITLGNKTFLDFEIGYSASEPTTVLFGVNDGNYTSTSVYGYFPEKVDENHIATLDLDYRVVYKEENGVFTEIMRMPGEDYEYRFASKEEYLNSMLTEEQLKDMARDLGVPEDLDVRYIQGERSYWEAGECWEIYVLVCTGNKCIASCSINPDNGEWTRNTAMYDPDHAWEVNF